MIRIDIDTLEGRTATNITAELKEREVLPVEVGRGGRVVRAQVSKSRGPGFNPTDAVSNLGQVRLPHVA